MKTKVLLQSLLFSLCLAVLLTFLKSMPARAASPGPTAEPAAITVSPREAGSTDHINVKALTANLEFLGAKPALTGHPVLIEFWATWCPPCRESIVHLNKLESKYHRDGLAILGITGEDKAVVERFRANTPINYNVALDRDQALAAEFQVQAIPQAWLLDKDGRVVWSGHPMQLDEQIIAQLLPSHAASDA